MKRFTYRAKDKQTSQILKGSIQAEDERTAGRLLIDQGYIPESIAEEGFEDPLTKVRNRVTTKDRIIFTRQLATLIGAGLPLSVSLRTVAEQTRGKGMKVVAEEILTAVESGKSLRDAFAEYPRLFNGVYLALISAGEKSGTLDLALRRLADQEEKDSALIAKIRGALIYPTTILIVIIAALAFMMNLVVPQVQDLYADLGAEMPALTNFLVGVSNFFIHAGWIIVIILIILIGGGLYMVKRTKAGRETADWFKVHVPLFGTLYRKLYVSRFARTAEMMLATGVPMLDSIQISIDAMNNVVVEEEFKKSLADIKGGKALSESLTGLDYMLPLVPQMAGIGEQSGKIDEMLGRAAGVYEAEVDEQITNLSTAIEPVLMVIMAGLIGLVIGGTLLPIYSLVNSISI